MGRPPFAQEGRPAARPPFQQGDHAPAPAPAAPRPQPNPMPALAETLRGVTADVKALKADLAQKDIEIKALQKRLLQMEVRQKSQEKALRAPKFVAEVSEEMAEEAEME